MEIHKELILTSSDLNAWQKFFDRLDLLCFHIDTPKEFPCLLVWAQVDDGAYGQRIIHELVYPSDFG